MGREGLKELKETWKRFNDFIVSLMESAGVEIHELEIIKNKFSHLIPPVFDYDEFRDKHKDILNKTMERKCYHCGRELEIVVQKKRWFKKTLSIITICCPSEQHIKFNIRIES